MKALAHLPFRTHAHARVRACVCMCMCVCFGRMISQGNQKAKVGSGAENGEACSFNGFLLSL